MTANALAQAALDAIALHGIAEDLAHGEAYAGAGRVAPSVWRPEGEEEAELLGELLARTGINALVVGVFAEAEQGVGGGRSHG